MINVTNASVNEMQAFFYVLCGGLEDDIKRETAEQTPTLDTK